MVVHGLSLAWLWVQTLVGEPKLNSLFAKISFSLKVKGHGNPSWLRSNQGWLKNRL